MTRSEAKQAMTEFVDKNVGKTVVFGSLDESEKMAFVMVSSFEYFRFLKPAERLDRAVANAEAQMRVGFAGWEETASITVED